MKQPFTYSMGSKPIVVHLRYNIILGSLGVLPQEIFFCFEQSEITSGAFLDIFVANQRVIDTNSLKFDSWSQTR